MSILKYFTRFLKVFVLHTLLVSNSFAFDLKQGELLLSLGGYEGIQGNHQVKQIRDLNDEYTVTQFHDRNWLAGLGYYLPGFEHNLFNFSYGINGFYLGNATVKGNIVQELVHTNLSYSYQITHVPIYAMAKTILNNNADYVLTFDTGIGPNITNTHDYNEQSLDNGITIPDNIFSGKYFTTFSATIGVGLRFNHIFGNKPLECGYRFFYLGQSELQETIEDEISDFKTGTMYAHALTCSVII